MPSPIGHVLCGLAVGLAGEASANRVRRDDSGQEAGAHVLASAEAEAHVLPLTLWAAFVAAAPDLDLVLHLGHRTVTHSVVATLFVMSIAAAVTGKVTGRIDWRAVVVLGAAHASHLLTDWLGVDPFVPSGIQLLWPFSDRFFVSGLDLFPMTERNFAKPFLFVVSVNAWAAFVELAVMMPLVWLAALARRRRRSRGPISARAVQRQPSA